MLDFLLIGLIIVLSATLIYQIADLFRIKDEQIVSYQKALVEAYTTIELMKLGVMK